MNKAVCVAPTSGVGVLVGDEVAVGVKVGVLSVACISMVACALRVAVRSGVGVRVRDGVGVNVGVSVYVSAVAVSLAWAMLVSVKNAVMVITSCCSAVRVRDFSCSLSVGTGVTGALKAPCDHI